MASNKMAGGLRFARITSHVADLNTRNKLLTAKLLRQGYRYHKLRKAFSKFYRRHLDIVPNIMSDFNHYFCKDRWHAWLLIQFRLTALLTSLIARRKVGLQTD